MTILSDIEKKLRGLISQGSNFVQQNPTPMGFVQQQIQKLAPQPTGSIVQRWQNQPVLPFIPQSSLSNLGKVNAGVFDKLPSSVYSGIPLTQVPGMVTGMVGQTARIIGGKATLTDIATAPLMFMGGIKKVKTPLPSPIKGVSPAVASKGVKQAIGGVGEGIKPTVLESTLKEAQVQKPQLPPVPSIAGGQSSSLPPSIPQDPIQKIIQALKVAKPLEQKQGQIYSKIRSQQSGAIAGIGKNILGEAGFHAQLGQLKGEMPKVTFESIRKQITQPDIDSLFNTIEQANITPFEKITAKNGLAKLIGAEGGSVPVKSELNLLNEIFPSEFVQAVLDKKPLMEKMFSIGENVLNLPRAIMATADLSAPLRQGVFLIGRPKQWIPAFRDMFKYALSEKAYKGLAQDIQKRPTYPLMRENKLALTDMSENLLSREEAFMSNLSEKIPIFGRIAKGSNRAYSGFLNKLRADTFDSLIQNAEKLGLDIKTITPDIAKFVNSATGRGELGALQTAAPVLNGLFFSPRLMASRLNLLNPVYYAQLNPFVRKEALKSLFTFATVGMTIAGLAKLGGADVGIDPRSADFGKIKVGDTRYDPWGGFQQYLVLASRLISGQMVSSTTGKEFTLGEGYKPTTRFDIIQRFFESKEAPVISFITALLRGQTSMGEKINLPVEVVDRFIPMMVQDMYDLYRENGLPGIAMAIPGIFGVGSQTYTDQIPMTGKTPMGKPNVQWRQAPGLGEQLLNKVTGTQVSNIPQDQWQSLIDKRQLESQWNIEYSGVKAKVLETGQPQTVRNPITNKDINVFLKDGVVTTKDVTPKITIPKTIIKKSSSVKTKKSAKVTMRKISAPAKITFKGFGAGAALKSVKLTKPKKLVHKNIKLKLATQKLTIPTVKVKKYKTLTSGVKLV